MSRVDYVSVIILAVCLTAVGYIGYTLYKNSGSETKEPTEQNDTNNFIDEEEEEDPYEYDIENDIDSTGVDEEEDVAFTPDEDESDLEEEDNTEEEIAERKVPDSFSNDGLGAFMVLAGSYTVKQNAEIEASRLRKKGYDNASVELFNRGKYASVLVDRFESEADAKALAKKLKEGGLEAFVLKKR